MDFNKENTLCFTGHRPKEKLNGYDPKDNLPMLNKLKVQIELAINQDGVINFISGMALGIDMWAARIVLNLKKKYPQIKLIAAVPCEKQYNKWKQEGVDEWNGIISKVDYVHYVSNELYTAWCMQVRNEWMVNNSKYVLAVWDGSKGGTGNCVKYALKKDVRIIQLHPKTLEITKIK